MSSKIAASVPMPATREAYNGFRPIVVQEQRFDKFFTIADTGKKALRQKACIGFGLWGGITTNRL
jgi:hypothetical protein